MSIQNPVQLGEHSEPQPHVALLRTRVDFYAEALPAASDVLLVIEVTDASIGLDRDVKISLYARAGITEVWLVDLTLEYVDVYRQPSSIGYQWVNRLQRRQRLTPQALPDVELTVEQILG